MGNLFGIRRRAPVVTAQDRAILQLKQQRDKIRIYQKKLEADVERNKDLALQLFQNGHKDRALVVLRRKKCMDEVISRTDKQLETLEQLVTDIEYTQIEVSVVEGLKVGTEALKQLNSLMNIDDIQQMMEDNEEAAEKQKEITNILSKASERYDEDDLLKELDALQQEQQPEKTAAPTKETTPSREAVVESEDVQASEPETTELQPEPDQLIDLQGDEGPVTEDRIEGLPDVPTDMPEKPEKEETRRSKQKEKRQLEPAQ